MQINDAQIDACTIVSATLTNSEVSFVYSDRDGVTSLRFVQPRALKRCKNGRTILRAFDTQRNAPRSFHYEGIAVGTVAKVPA